ncbi:DUF3165 domain-containing protein [Lactococcus lactis]|nr:DUF3165 domain-containing protein [Lactococcus lactis]
MMPKDVRRSMDIFFFAGVGVLFLAFAVAQAVSHRSLLLEIIGIVAMLVVTVRAWMELEKLDSRKRKK